MSYFIGRYRRHTYQHKSYQRYPLKYDKDIKYDTTICYRQSVRIKQLYTWKFNFLIKK